MSKKLLLIGNGPSALAKKMGREIDDYNGTVLRFNSYVTDDFQEYVGSRTDFWWTMADFDSKTAERKHKARFFVDSKPDEPLPHYYCNKIVSGLHYNLREDSITETVSSSWFERAKEILNCEYPTNGAIAVLYFLDKEYEIELWGFDFMIKGRPHHYANDEKLHQRGEQHDENKEWLFFNRLLESGRIKYFGHNPETEGIPIIRQPVPCGTDDDPEWNRKSTHEGWYDFFGQKFAGKSFLDVGAGLGGGMKVLRKYSDAIVGFEVDPRMARQDVIIDDNLRRFKNDAYDVVVCVDVIEHVVEDLILFRDMKRIARKAVCITTPNATRTKAQLVTHCREYTIAQFANIFQPTEIWSGRPDGGAQITKLLTREISSQFEITLVRRFNNTHDGMEWSCIAAIFYNPIKNL